MNIRIQYGKNKTEHGTFGECKIIANKKKKNLRVRSLGSFSFLSTIFQGEQVIKADKLIEISTEDIHISPINIVKNNR